MSHVKTGSRPAAPHGNFPLRAELDEESVVPAVTPLRLYAAIRKSHEHIPRLHIDTTVQRPKPVPEP
jgi:hypothetical protein